MIDNPDKQIKCAKSAIEQMETQRVMNDVVNTGVILPCETCDVARSCMIRIDLSNACDRMYLIHTN
jgi:hypothetical protein